MDASSPHRTQRQFQHAGVCKRPRKRKHSRRSPTCPHLCYFVISSVITSCCILLFTLITALSRLTVTWGCGGRSGWAGHRLIPRAAAKTRISRSVRHLVEKSSLATP